MQELHHFSLFFLGGGFCAFILRFESASTLVKLSIFHLKVLSLPVEHFTLDNRLPSKFSSGLNGT